MAFPSCTAARKMFKCLLICLLIKSAVFINKVAFLHSFIIVRKAFFWQIIARQIVTFLDKLPLPSGELSLSPNRVQSVPDRGQ